MNSDPNRPIDFDALDQGFTAERERIRAATTRIKLILDTDGVWADDQHMVISTNPTLEAAQSFLRDHLDHPLHNSDPHYEDYATEFNGTLTGFTAEHGARILNDLQIIWDDEFSRDFITELAISMSLCPMHFCDWAACFDDDDAECFAIRTIYPHSHDT